MTKTSKREKIKKRVKASIPKDWLTEVRITYRLIIETFKGIAQTGLVNLAIITTIAAILTIFGSIFRTTLSISGIVNEMGSILEISAYLKPSANVGDTISEIKKFEHVQAVKFTSKEKSWAELKREIDVPDVVNPLPDTLHIKIDDPKNIERVMENVKTVGGVEDLSYAKDLVQKFQMINKISHTVTLLVIVISCILTIAVISNTIELVIQSRKEEIEIMRLMGVNNWYIKTPLVLQGAIYGFVGALIAIIPVNIIQSYLLKMHSFFMIPTYSFAQPLAILSVLILGIACSAGGSLMSIKKHIEV